MNVVPSSSSPCTERPRTLAGRGLVADHADLREHAQQPAASRDATDLERAPVRRPLLLIPVVVPRRKTRETPCYWILSTAALSSSTETVPSKRAFTVPSEPTRNIHGSEGSFHSRTQVFSPFVGSLSL